MFFPLMTFLPQHSENMQRAPKQVVTCISIYSYSYCDNRQVGQNIELPLLENAQVYIQTFDAT